MAEPTPIKRQAAENLARWKNSEDHKPLLIRGARQVGKSYLVDSFGKENFENIITVNFELEPRYKACFQSLKPNDICALISALSQQKIVPGKTLLFLDEIQDCEEAIRSLRYFKELYPELHVIGASSLLELALRQTDYRFPVGRVTSMHLYPLSFKEFLQAMRPETLAFIQNASLENPVPEAIHALLLQQLKLYFYMGGMPEVVTQYQSSKRNAAPSLPANTSENAYLLSAQTTQSDIIHTYEKDFGHYATRVNLDHLRKCFQKIPHMLGEQIKYNKIDPDIKSRELKVALSMLEDAYLLHRVHATTATGFPLDATLNEKKFKFAFLDVGLITRINQLSAPLLLGDDPMLINRGALTEQFVAQELLAYAPDYEKTKLYFWARDDFGTAEIDFVLPIGSHIVPIEVKAGKTGTLRSLKVYQNSHHQPLGIRLSTSPLSRENNILSIPLYLISEISRLYMASI